MYNIEQRKQNKILDIALEAIDSHAWDILEQQIEQSKDSNKRLILSYLEMKLESV